jgi:putative DNA primase/helicase
MKLPPKSAAPSKKGSKSRSVLDAALAAHAAGLSVIDVRADGTKQPVRVWKRFQSERASQRELRSWFAREDVGLGLVLGAVSGNCECLDIESAEAWEAFERAAIDADVGDVLKRVEDGYCEQAPRGGRHLLWRCSTIAGNHKLAVSAAGDTLIETRGEGGYVIVAPSEGRVHETRRPYVLLSGRFDDIAEISPEEREALLCVARSLDQRPAKEVVGPSSCVAKGRPGDDFNQRADWRSDVLEPAGWKLVSSEAGTQYWRRAGKSLGYSATLNHGGRDLLHVFSSSTPLEPNHSYTKFTAYAHLHHDRDFSAAASALRSLGYGGDAPHNQRRAVSQFDVVGTAKQIASGTQIRRGPEGGLYRYVNGLYVADAREFVRARSLEVLDRGFSKNKVATLMEYFECRQSEPFHVDASLINLANGLLDWRTGELRPHTPDFFTTVQIPVRWQPDAKGEAIERFLGQVLVAEDIEPFLEYLGALIARWGLPMAALLLGNGRNGKSTLLAVIRALLGAENCSAVPLQALCDDRFAVAELQHKLANICGDIDAAPPRSVAMFKQLTGGDPVYAQRKYGQPYSFISTARPLFAANELPRVARRDDAYYARWQIFEFPRYFPPDKADESLLQRLTAPEELEGLLVLVVRAMQRLAERGYFEPSVSMQRALERYRGAAGVLDRYIQSLQYGRHREISRERLYSHHLRWCTREDVAPVGTAQFANAIRQELGRRYPSRNIELKSSGERRWLRVGIGLKLVPVGQPGHRNLTSKAKSRGKK